MAIGTYEANREFNMRGESKPEVCVIGLGYIGLPTAAIIARASAQSSDRRSTPAV